MQKRQLAQHHATTKKYAIHNDYDAFLEIHFIFIHKFINMIYRETFKFIF